MAALAITMSVKAKGTAPRIVTAEPADMVAFEREFGKSISSLQTDVFLTDLFWLAWHAEKRTGSSTLDFDAWVNMLETVEAVGGDELAPLESNQPIG